MDTNLTQHIIVFVLGAPRNRLHLFDLQKPHECCALTAFGFYAPVSRIYISSGFIQFEWSYYFSCFLVTQVSHRAEKKRTSMYLFLCKALVSPSSAARGQQQKSLCIQREGGLAIGLPRQQGTVQAWWGKKSGSELIGKLESPGDTFVH